MLAQTFPATLPIIKIGTNGRKTTNKKKCTTFGTKACGYCGEKTKNNKQKKCTNEICRGLTPYFPKKTKPPGLGMVCPKSGCGWSTKGNRTHKCKKCGTAYPSKAKRKAYVLSKKRKKEAPKGASKKRKKTKMMAMQPTGQSDGVNSCPVFVVSQNDPQSVSKHATIGIGDSFFQQMLEEFEAECPPKCGSAGRLSRENSLSYGGNLSQASKQDDPQNATIRTDDPGFKHLFDELEASLGPVSLSRGNSLSELGPVSLSRGNSLFGSGPVSLSRDNSLSEFNLVEMYSEQALPDTDYTIESHGGVFKM
jgi:hypothetical protein